jgi:hypothetical protein
MNHRYQQCQCVTTTIDVKHTLRLVYFQQNKTRRKPKVKIVTLQLLYVESGKTDIVYMKNSPHLPLRQITEEKRRGKELRVV